MNQVAMQNDPSTPLAESGNPENFEQYRSVSKSAVACTVFAILGLLSFFSPVFVTLSICGTIFGFYSLSLFKKFPGELVGRAAAKFGLIVSLICVVGGITYHSIIYATEVPEGYQRISFSELVPNKRDGLAFSKRAAELNGEQVFLKGYVRPSDKKHGLKKFILVGDFGSCCFGGNPKITDVVAVNIANDQSVDYSFRLRRIGGKFKLHPQPARTNEKEVPQVMYEIVADYIK